MGEKRKDNKGRVLRLGEQQRKDGRYIYILIKSLMEAQGICIAGN